MKITRVELDNIKKSNEFSSDIEAYKWILETFPKSIFFDDPYIMEIINEANEKLDSEKQKIVDKFYILVNNKDCEYSDMYNICEHAGHPDYSPMKTPMCSFEKCPLKRKFLLEGN